MQKPKPDTDLLALASLQARARAVPLATGGPPKAVQALPWRFFRLPGEGEAITAPPRLCGHPPCCPAAYFVTAPGASWRPKKQPPRALPPCLSLPQTAPVTACTSACFGHRLGPHHIAHLFACAEGLKG